MSPRRPLAAALAALAAAGLAACGPKDNRHEGSTEGSYVAAGPLTYQVQLSRELNPSSAEDQGYLRGLPAGTAQPSPSEEWFGVWMRVENDSHNPAKPASQFAIVDTQGNSYQPIALDTAVNPFAYNPATLAHGKVLPDPDSAAATTPTQGELLLFKLPTSVYSNRPLELQIKDQRGITVLARVTLDL